MVWKAELTAEVPVHQSSKERRQSSKRHGLTVALIVASLGILFWHRWPVVALPASVTFADQAVQSSGGEQLVVLTNVGCSPLHFQSAVIAADEIDDFRLTQSNCPNSSILPKQTCYVGIVFRPQAGGERNAILSFIDNANNSPQKVLLKGTGSLRADLVVAPNAFDFGTKNVSVLSEKEVTLANVGSASIVVDEIALAGEATGFSVAENNCVHQAIPSGANCIVKIEFNPTATGSQSARLTVHDDSASVNHVRRHLPRIVGLAQNRDAPSIRFRHFATNRIAPKT